MDVFNEEECAFRLHVKLNYEGLCPNEMVVLAELFAYLPYGVRGLSTEKMFMPHGDAAIPTNFPKDRVVRGQN